MPEFNLADFSDVITVHNASLTQFRSWRTLFSARADALADFVMTYPITSGAQVYWSQGQRRNHLRDCFAMDRRYQGNAASFNPWNGLWRGKWRYSGGSIKQFHLWDETVTNRAGQAIQPVTQSIHEIVHSGNLAEAREVVQGRARVDLGINVWTDADGLTGWVSKRQDFQHQELPHIAYSPNAHTLLWITQPDFSGDYWLFFEWAEPSTQKYGIHGKTFRTSGSDGIEGGVSLGWTTYSGMRRSAADLRRQGR